uniref:Uncharacterized protein n=1 Tax=Aplanochytrium stocchinoi TaxID=215587 RepID=A0A7S3V1I4_9STRA|mmetsp:Transcript_18826/g.21244  ORF Transcript_18826/g.21244 Transcript_18826/m.21244 type:complete len:357 (+) Transcript_18826:63-1133(+)
MAKSRRKRLRNIKVASIRKRSFYKILRRIKFTLSSLYIFIIYSFIMWWKTVMKQRLVLILILAFKKGNLFHLVNRLKRVFSCGQVRLIRELLFRVNKFDEEGDFQFETFLFHAACNGKVDNVKHFDQQTPYHLLTCLINNFVDNMVEAETAHFLTPYGDEMRVLDTTQCKEETSKTESLTSSHVQRDGSDSSILFEQVEYNALKEDYHSYCHSLPPQTDATGRNYCTIKTGKNNNYLGIQPCSEQNTKGMQLLSQDHSDWYDDDIPVSLRFLLASKLGYYEIVSYYLDNSMVDMKKFGYFALLFAHRGKFYDVETLLLSYDVHIDTTKNLHWFKGYDDVLDDLLSSEYEDDIQVRV